MRARPTIIRIVMVSTLFVAWVGTSQAGCNPGTQDIADCVSVPRAPSYSPRRGGGGGGGGGGYVSRGGGGANYGAALGAAGTALGVLGDILDKADEASDGSSPPTRSCQAGLSQTRDGYCLPRGTVYCGGGRFCEAGLICLNAGKTCRSQEDLDAERERDRAEVRQRDQARRGAQGELDDIYQRLARANSAGGSASQQAERQTLPADGNIFVGTNPFDHAGGPVQPSDVLNTARSRCNSLGEGNDDWKKCMIAQEARAILDGDQDIRANCAREATSATRDDCAIGAYVAKLKNQAALPTDENCYFRQNGTPCYPGGGASGGSGNANKPESLRDRLRKSLSSGSPGASQPDHPDAARATDSPLPAQAQQPQKDIVSSRPGYNPDDPLQNYMQSTNQSTGGSNSGRLRDPGERETDGLTPYSPDRPILDQR